MIGPTEIALLTIPIFGFLTISRAISITDRQGYARWEIFKIVLRKPTILNVIAFSAVFSVIAIASEQGFALWKAPILGLMAALSLLATVAILLPLTWALDSAFSDDEEPEQ